MNAAAATQKLIDTYKPDRIINTGVAGGVANDIELGEIVIASKLAYHDFHPLEILERNPPFSRLFTADETLVSLAERACEALGAKYRTGVVVSGDCFVNAPPESGSDISRASIVRPPPDLRYPYLILQYWSRIKLFVTYPAV